MALKVQRYELSITNQYQKVAIPHPARLLSCDRSRSRPDEKIDLWALAGPQGTPSKNVGIYITGTGHDVPAPVLSFGNVGESFIGTVVTPDGFVWHVWQGQLQ